MNKLLESFFQEVHNWLLWLIAFFALGIIIYFSLDTEPSIYALSIPTAVVFVCAIVFRKSPRSLMLLLPVLFLSLGMVTAKYRTDNIHTNKIHEDLNEVTITGTIESIYPLEKGRKIIIVPHSIEGLLDDALPKKIQLTTRRNSSNYDIGDLISTRASIFTISTQMFPNSYNFARHSYFQGIGATGYTFHKITVISTHKGNAIDRFRLYIFNVLSKMLGRESASVSAALMIGEQKSIPQTTIKDLRGSGLSHILSVSGMHLSLISIICFFFIRYFLSFFKGLSQQYNTKKIAGIISLFVTFIYLMLSGFQLAAVRAFIMVAFIIMAAVLDRESDAKRSVWLAALVILAFTPEAILHPSFQMSFSATLALVTLYPPYVSFFSQTKRNSMWGKIKIYAIGSMLSSIIAGFATSVFVIYHFKVNSNFSMLANLLASPIVSLISMPGVLLSFILLPFGEYNIGLYLLDFGNKLMLKISEFVASLPASTTTFPQMSETALALFTIGLTWLCIWERRWRFFGIVPMVVCFVLIFLQSYPDLIIDANHQHILIKSLNRQVIKYGDTKNMNAFYKENILKFMDGTEIIKVKDLGYTNYSYDLKNYNINIEVTNTKNHKQAFSKVYIASPANRLNLDTSDLEKNGTYFVYLKPEKIEYQYSVLQHVKRPWS